MSKSPEMVKFLDDFAKKAFGRPYTDVSVCITCGSNKVKSEDFNDNLSRKRFRISHMCQECLDKVFYFSEED